MVGKKGEENIGTFQEYFWQSIGEKVVKTVFDDGTLYGGIESA